MECEDLRGDFSLVRSGVHNGMDQNTDQSKGYGYNTPDNTADIDVDNKKRMDEYADKSVNGVSDNTGGEKVDLDKENVKPDMETEDGNGGDREDNKSDESSQMSERSVDIGDKISVDHMCTDSVGVGYSGERPEMPSDVANSSVSHDPDESELCLQQSGSPVDGRDDAEKGNSGTEGSDAAGLGHRFNLRKNPKKKYTEHQFSSDSDTELAHSKSHNKSLMKALMHTDNELMKFAEILYKCTLCTSIPSILTSKTSFLKHVQEQHFSKENCFKKCDFCSLRFRTDSDLKEHVKFLHKDTNRQKESTSYNQRGSDVRMRSHDSSKPDNDSDSDSSGHRSYNARLFQRIKPVLDFENPKQLVDHPGIQTQDGSLDLSKKDHSKRTMYKDSPVVSNADKTGGNQSREPNFVNVHQITDQIMKSNFQSRSQTSTPSNKFGFTPSFTPEFGKYTKLVREGGNIVYFCQVCNWRSPIKATFYGHCGTATHKTKVLQAEDPDCTDSPTNCDRTRSAPTPPSLPTSTAAGEQKSSRDTNIWTNQNRPFMSKLPDQNLYNQYMSQRNMTFNGRSPVGYPGKDGNSSSRHNNPFKRQADIAMDLAKGGKAGTPNASGSKIKSEGVSSDSDSDEAGKSSNDQNFPWKPPFPISSMYPNFPMLPMCPPPTGQRPNFENFFSQNAATNKLIRDTVIRSETSATESHGNPSDYPSTSNEDSHHYPHGMFAQAAGKRRPEDRDGLDEPPHKQAKDHTANHPQVSEGSENTDTLFKLYKCHACPFEYSDIEEYEKHFDEDHKNMDQPEARTKNPMNKQPPMLNEPISGEHEATDNFRVQNYETGENFRVQKLKDILPDFIVEEENGSLSRDCLLSSISMTGAIPNVELWSSACNKAMRELYPKSIAMRRGKYKKTHYFGVSLVEYGGRRDEAIVQTDGNRDLNIDIKKVMEQLPSIVFWTGDMNGGILREEVLMVLVDRLQSHDVFNWGVQCNRALKHIFPKVDIRRKGKFKSTTYFGVDFQHKVKKLFFQAAMLGQPKNLLMARQVFDGGEPVAEAVPKNVAPGEDEFAAWMKQEAHKHMQWYLHRFGGTSAPENKDAEEGGDDADNDGDDERDSVKVDNDGP